MPIEGNYIFSKKEQNFYYVCFLPNTSYSITTDILYLFKKEMQAPGYLVNFYASYFVLFIDEIANLQPNTKIEIKYQVFGRKNYRNLNLVSNITINYVVPIIIDVCLFIHQSEFTNFELYEARIRVYNKNTMELLQENLVWESYNNKIIDLLQSKIEFKFSNMNLAKSSQYAYSLGGYNEMYTSFKLRMCIHII
ncbi:MAG: hypothetical protein NZ839_05365 [Endomicrobia bacterium]|nr:hypothetical protein [Endomicrobiia bacterium]